MILYKASAAQWPAIVRIAEASWRVGYAGILSSEQIDFMLNRSYVQQDFQGATQAGESFYLLREGEEDLGFIALTQQDRLLRIEKLYLLPSAQGKGCGKILLDFAKSHAQQLRMDRLGLNVNRGNVKAYDFYLKQGFLVTDTVDIPYFGYVLDDYVMEHELKSQKP